jgi:hypothetical protein
MTTLEQEFRTAWSEAQGDSFSARIIRQSLEASAQQSPDLSNVLFELKNLHQAELDLHLDGESVKNHSANAEDFANFVRGIADAVKEITKSALGRERMASGLLVTAPTPGSVRVVLKAASPAEQDGHIDTARSETQDSNSLRIVATLLARADDDDTQTSVVEGLLVALPMKARPGIRRVARAVSESGWEITGVLRRPKEGAEELHIGGAGARKLLDALDNREVETSVVTVDGQVDGQRRSMGTMWFSPVVGTPIEASVVQQELLEKVAALSASASSASATFTVVAKYPPGTVGSVRKSYILTAIEGLPETSVTLDL